MQTTPVVQRFVIRDLEGNSTNRFPDYTVEVNPTEYNPHVQEEMFQFKVALSGRRGAIKFPRQPETRTMSWDSIHRTMYLELRNRANSGNTFYLFDHNSEEAIGVVTEFNFDEIVATVPSRYKGSLTWTTIGKPQTSINEY
jgi:hypothetical protein